MGFAQNLVELRKSHNLSQEELAEKLCITRQTLSKYETGESVPDIEKCKHLADFFDVSLDDLIRYEGNEVCGFRPSVPPKGKHVFGMATVGDKGQIVLPSKARKLFGIREGDKLIVLGDEEQGIALIKEEELLKILEQARL